MSADLLHYDDAVNDLEPVRARETWDAETACYLGIAYDGLGRSDEAKRAFEAARLLPDFHATATLRLAELEARNRQFEAAAMDMTEALRSAPDDPRTAEELAAVLRALGENDAARRLANQWLTRYPASYFLREELGKPDNAHLGAEVSRVLNVAAEYMRLGLYQKALAVLSLDYPAVPADQREPGEVGVAPSADTNG